MDVAEVTGVDELQINPRFKDAIPPLSPEEYSGLCESILAEGCRDAIIVWNGQIVDGHNRFEICRELDIPFRTFERAFEDEDAVVEWIMRNQLSRRNLSDVERGRIALQLKEIISARARENCSLGGGDRKSESVKSGLAKLPTPITSTHTRAKLAKIAGIGERTLSKIEKVDNEAPEVIKAAMGKTISIDRAAQLNAALKDVPENGRDAEAEAMLKAECAEKMERICREERIMKKIHNLIASAALDYYYINAECVDVYIRRTPVSVASIRVTIRDQIQWLEKLDRLFVERDAARRNGE
jgi:ParB-like chromosome segregation protein Spo0J